MKASLPVVLLSILLGVLGGAYAYALEGPAADLAAIPREKIYIQTDRSFYAKGDTVWFKCNLVDGATNIPSTSPLYPRDRSGFVYVELHDCRADTLMERYKIKSDSLGVFANALPLEYDIEVGDYMMVAYTQWMLNFGDRGFGYKQFSVVGAGSEAQNRLSPNENGLKVKACPEGGMLLAGELQNLTYLITDSKGYPIRAEVRLVDAGTDSVIVSSEMESPGFGELMFKPRNGARYVLEAFTPGGAYGRTEIDGIREAGAAIRVKQRKGKIHIGVSGGNPATGNMQLVIVSKGKSSTMIPSTGNISIDASSLEEGIVMLLLVDAETGEILSTRKFYNR